MNAKFFWLYCALLFNSSVICAQIFQNEENFEKTQHSYRLTTKNVEEFFDSFVPQQIDHANVAGVVVAVVKDGRLIFAKGYGYADKAKKIPISPEKTLFRVGSISKLFIWTAVMQQLEQGRLDLDRDFICKSY